MNSNTTLNHPYGPAAFFSTVARHITARRWWYLAGIILITALFVSQMSKLRFDNSSDIWFVEGHHSLAAKASFDTAFGNDEFVYLLFTKEKTPFTPKNFQQMEKLAEAFDNSIPYLKDVTWLGNAERIRGRSGEEVAVEDFLDPLPTTKADIEKKLDEALTEPSFVHNLISPDKTALAMILELGSYPPEKEDSNPRYTTAEAVNKILAEPRFAELHPWVGGGPHFSYNYDALVKRDMGKLFLLVIAVQMGLLFFFGRGTRGVAVPLTITILAVVWTLGTIGIIGFTLNLLSTALPIMLICVSIGDAMHAISAFHSGMLRGLSRKEALTAAFSEVGLALMLTSFTTAIGFLAYLSCEVAPYRAMGIYVACGVIYAFLLTLILTPIFYSFGKEKAPEERIKKEKNDMTDRWLLFCHRLVTTRPKAVVVCFTIIMAVTFMGYLNMKVESNTAKLVFKGEPLRDTLDTIDERMGTGSSLEFLIDTGKESGIKSPEFMEKIDELMLYAESHPAVTKAASVTTVIKQMRRALHNNDPAYYSVPKTPEAVAQYLFLYESSGGNMLDRQVGFLYDLARLTVKTPTIDTAIGRQLITDMKKEISRLFGDTVKTTVSGGMARYVELNDILYTGQQQSFLAALCAITVVMMLVLHSIKLGALSMIPNIFPVFLSMGFLGLIGYYLDVITISYAAVIIGVAVDDSIHFFTRFQHEFARLGRYREALAATYISVGRPLTQTTMALVIGNAVMMFSSILGFFKLGLLFGVAFTSALLADFFFAPALILLLQPLGKERESEQHGIIKNKEMRHA